MEITVFKSNEDDIRNFRIQFLHENNFQFTYNKCHEYGWADVYLFKDDDIVIGYGSVWGKDKREDRDSIFEFFLINPYRKHAHAVFEKFYTTAGTGFIECQSNDFLLTSMLYEFAGNISAESILFEDHYETHLHIPGTVFRERISSDILDNDDGYVLLYNDGIVASGGLMLNYNFPYADIYMGVKENFREKGFGSLIVQELKKRAYEIGRVPAARCNIRNMRSKPTLLKAGLRICGWRLIGEIKKIVEG